MRRLALLCLVLPLACSRETPAPPAPPTPTATVAPQPVPVTQTSVPELQKGTYDEALLWFRSTPKFHFVLDDEGVHAEGQMTRKTIGAEQVQFRAEGAEWLAESTVQGVTWKRRSGNSWKPAAAPDFGGRIYQRVTLPFDPKKEEDVPLLVSSEGETNLYRFTNANTGEVHEVSVRKDGSISRMTIAGKVELKIGG